MSMITASGFSGPQFHDDVGTTVFYKTVPPSTFHPVGANVEDPGELEEVRIFYYPVSSSIDSEWLGRRMPRNGDELFKLLGEAFAQYCSAPWCGMDVRDKVLAAVGEYSDEPTYHLFKKDGYPPFFEIQSVHLYPAIDSIVVRGRTDIDQNLAEHGVDIMISAKGVEFGYGADFMDLTDPPASPDLDC